MRWCHLTWPVDLTLRDLGLKFSQPMRKKCMIRCAKNSGAARRRFLAIWKKRRGALKSPPPIRAKVNKHRPIFQLAQNDRCRQELISWAIAGLSTPSLSLWSWFVWALDLIPHPAETGQLLLLPDVCDSSNSVADITANFSITFCIILYRVIFFLNKTRKNKINDSMASLHTLCSVKVGQTLIIFHKYQVLMPLDTKWWCRLTSPERPTGFSKFCN